MSDVSAGPPAATRLPVIAVVGRPNVGKSTLFNRLTRSRQALVAPVPGTTRDRREGAVAWPPYRFALVDTGGMGFDRAEAFSAEVEAQISRAVADADLIWLLLDVTEGLTPYDEALHRWVVRQGKPFLVVVNKGDSPQRRRELAEFYALGVERLYAVSAEHGYGVTELLEGSAEVVPGLVETAAAGEPASREEDAEGADRPLRVVFLGRPNVGKSSLVNRILGDARMIVSPTAGTTREAIELPFEAYGREVVLVDTAGLRRRSRTKEYLDKLSALNALGALNRVDVAVLVLDAADEVAGQDARIANAIVEHQRAVVIAANKWDRVPRGQGKAVEADIRERLRFLPYAALVRTSATEGQGLERLFRAIGQAAEQFNRRIQTADLNRVVEATELRTPPPARGRSRTRVYYGVQTGRRPPSFAFYTNHPEQIQPAYTRFFENQLRYHFGLKGTPIRIQWRERPARAKRTAPRAGRG